MRVYCTCAIAFVYIPGTKTSLSLSLYSSFPHFTGTPAKQFVACLSLSLFLSYSHSHSLSLKPRTRGFSLSTFSPGASCTHAPTRRRARVPTLSHTYVIAHKAAGALARPHRPSKLCACLYTARSFAFIPDMPMAARKSRRWRRKRARKREKPGERATETETSPFAALPPPPPLPPHPPFLPPSRARRRIRVC